MTIQSDWEQITDLLDEGADEMARGFDRGLREEYVLRMRNGESREAIVAEINAEFAALLNDDAS